MKCWCASIACLVACFTTPMPTRPHTGLVRGTVVDAATRRPLRGAVVMAGGPCLQTIDAPFVETDDHGRYSIALPVGTCGLSLTYKDAVDIHDHIAVRSSATATVDFALNHDAATWHTEIPETCPGSPDPVPDHIGTGQADADGIARAVLERFAAYRNTMPGGVQRRSRDPVFVVMQLRGSKITLSASALPSTFRTVFIAKTLDELKAEVVKPVRLRQPFITFSIDSTATCARVVSGYGGFELGIDIYEKRGDTWSYVKRVGIILS